VCRCIVGVQVYCKYAVVFCSLSVMESGGAMGWLRLVGSLKL